MTTNLFASDFFQNVLGPAAELVLVALLAGVCIGFVVWYYSLEDAPDPPLSKEMSKLLEFKPWWRKPENPDEFPIWNERKGHRDDHN